MVGTYLRKLRLLNRDARLYLVTWAVLGFCWMGIYMTLFNLYLLRLGHNAEFVGLVNAAGALVFAIFSLPAGALGGRWGVRRMMVIGVSMNVMGLGLPLLGESVPVTMREGWLLTTFSLGWLGMALWNVNGDVFLTAKTTQAERGHAFSVMMSLLSLAGFAGSLVGGLLPAFFSTVLQVTHQQPGPYRYALAFAAALFATSIPVLLATREVEAVGEEECASGAGPGPYGLIVLMAVVQVLQAGGEAAARTFFNVYLDAGLGVATHRIGTLTAAAQLIAVPAALATPLLMSRWGNGRTFIRASLAMALSLLPLALIPHWASAGLGYVGVTALAMVWRPAFVLYRMELVPPAWRALLNGASIMALGLSMGAMSWAGGLIVTALGYRSLFLTGASVTAVGALLFWIHFRRQRGEIARRSVEAPGGATG